VNILSFRHFFFFFLFCNYVFIVFRSKKLRAALAMEKIKPIKQAKKTEEIYITNKYLLSGWFLLRRAIGHIERKVQTSSRGVTNGKPT